jgi:DNA-binding response OmpR family regulator
MVRVVLVEPDKLLAETYGQVCKQAGVTVHTENNAQDAILAIDKYHPKLIVLELQLANHNGVEFLYELRSHSDWQKIPVLLHTLIPATDLQINATIKQQLGIAGYLYKPQTSLRALLSEIQKIVGKL